jgi:hypothetical protein
MGVKFRTIGLERCLVGTPHSSSAQWVVQEDIPAESKTILDESGLILATQVDGLKVFRPKTEGWIFEHFSLNT